MLGSLQPKLVQLLEEFYYLVVNNNIIGGLTQQVTRDINQRVPWVGEEYRTIACLDLDDLLAGRCGRHAPATPDARIEW